MAARARASAEARTVGRTIIHADLDAFYASVAQIDNPELRGKPVVVGGPPEARGVVAAASYEARRCGVRSAMPMSRALRLCPDAVRVSPRFDRYHELSRRVMAIFRAVTPKVEPLSLDEAFLDVTPVLGRHGDGESIARELKRQVRDATGLTLSVGVGSNKTVAKIASGLRKPDGLVVVPSGDEAAFLAPLPVRSLWGIGPKTEARLAAAGIKTIGDLASQTEQALEALLGSAAKSLISMARGVDEREVVTERQRKSIGAETTFARDLEDGPELRAQLRRIAREVARRMQSGGINARTVAIKLRYADFRTITRQMTVDRPLRSARSIEEVAGTLLDAVAPRGDRIRLLGVHCSKLSDHLVSQGELWEEP
jgi:DNA polymerase-4